MALPRNTTATPLPADTYAPCFKIKMGDAEFTEQLNQSLLDIQVVRELDKTGTLSLTLSNWDELTMRLRFDDAKQFAAGQSVEVRLGYAWQEKPPVVAKGQVTTVQPDFPSSGPPTLQVSCQDRTTQMKDRKPLPGDEKKFLNLADWQIVNKIAERHGLEVVAEEEGVVHPLVVQKNQDDVAFLLERAKGIDRELYVAPDPGSGEETLFFVCPADGRAGSTKRQPHTFDLWYAVLAEGARSGRAEQGEASRTSPEPNLISFRPTLKLAGQVAKVTVRGWNPRTKKAIVASATRADLQAERDAGRSGPSAAAEEMGDREEVIVDRPVSSEPEARALAVSVLRDKSYQFVTCTGQLAGLPDLVPSDSLRIGGVGSRFGGTYYTTKVTHSFNSSGFFTSFEARRTSEGR
ncbi:type IV secretion protein Rhs [Streptomyces sp. NBC_01381]|uniref:phage late control D family protein n=1 Tax=Streptomyces sp. NBC_01381 TaxID=2903845 RepID=UPI00225874D7|nr:type IV secretion protein Rhs [Streptomyces sp. NBC_01381]MCX4673188.1 type IV secretion protein Rhs [Streptomyces sp. NBC_01381]